MPAKGRAGRDVRILVLGIGNQLLGDEGAGIAALRLLEARCSPSDDLRFEDGGTLGFTLAGWVAECDALLVFDAANLESAPGSVAAFEGPGMDDFLGARRAWSVHAAGLADLMAVSMLEGRWPACRALVGVQPEAVGWSERLSPAVEGALETMVGHGSRLIAAWRASAPG